MKVTVINEYCPYTGMKRIVPVALSKSMPCLPHLGYEHQCNNRNALVTIYDVEKTITHELWHIMETEHDGERTSVVFYNGNTCPQADTPNAHDKTVLDKVSERGAIR